MEGLVIENHTFASECCFLSKLNKLKKDGTLDVDKYFSQQTTRWRNILRYDQLELFIRHNRKEFRLITLEILAESKKSTLRFTSKELDMILLFLKHNLCEKIEYLPFIKKVLKRFRDSLAVMRRQWTQKIKMKDFNKKQDIASETHKEASALFDQTLEQIEQNIKDYTMFCINLREICVNNLYPDATYRRRYYSLQILSLAQEFLYNEFKDIEWKNEQIIIMFQCLILDTYEYNKEMAYQLLRHTNIFLSFSDLRVLTQMIEIAFELGKSIRPIDSITAAYMLKISMLSPVIKDVLNDIRQKSQSFEKDYLNYCDKVDDNITEATTLQLILLLYGKLKEASVLLTLNIGQAIVTCSLYGYLFCMRSLLSDCNLREAGKNKLWRITVDNIITLCIQLDQAVSVVVNNSSPEGHLPIDLKTLNIDDNASFPENVTPQMVLICSWRTVKEVSHLLGLFATKASIATFNDELLSKQQIEYMMSHFVSLLCETKHRGAFEQAYVGFHQLCTQLWQSTIVDLKLLPIRCAHDTLIGITGLIPGYSKLCATRRSAGVPFLIQGLVASALITGDKSNRQIFHSVMNILLRFTELKDTDNLWPEVKDIMYGDFVFSRYKDIIEPKMESKDEHHKIKPNVIEIKTHSMNILRALFRHSKFSDMVKPYAAEGLIVAFKHYDGRTWAERNAATLLFGALIVRIFGVQRTQDHINLTTCNKMTGKLFFKRYFSLLPFIQNELRTFVSTNDTMMKSNVQAILLLLSRLYGDYEKRLTWEIRELRNLVSQCAKSPVYQIRELASRALISLLVDEDTAYASLSNLLQLVSTATLDIRVFRISANLVHGYLLQILEILRKFENITKKCYPYQFSDFLSISQCILSCSNSGPDSFNHFPLATVYIDVLHIIYNRERIIMDHCKMQDIFHILIECVIKKDLSKPKQLWPGELMYKVSVMKFILSTHTHVHSNLYKKYFQTENDGQSKVFEIWSQLLVSPEAELQIIAWDTIKKVFKANYKYESQLLMVDHVMLVATNFTKDLHKYGPDVLDAFFYFLDTHLRHTQRLFDNDHNEGFLPDHVNTMYKICNLVLREIHSHNASNVYIRRVNYLLLLGQCMITVMYYLKDENLEMEYKKDIYRKVCSSDWISAALGEQECSQPISNIVKKFFIESNIHIEQCHPVLDWWTMALQLLVDDNAIVRSHICESLYSIGIFKESGDHDTQLSVFFQEFNSRVASEYPEIAISALFCWSVSLFGDADYEMDETDVFNKCRNYDVFEPVRISQMCYVFIASIMQRYSIDNVLPSNVIEWINFHLDTTFVALSFREIVHLYISNMPKIERELVDILDPAYKDKLLQNLACEKYMTL